MNIPTVTQQLANLAETFIHYADDSITVHPGEVVDLEPIFDMVFTNYTANTGLEPNPDKAATYVTTAYVPEDTNTLLHYVANPRFYVDNFNRFHASKKPYDYPIGAEMVGFIVSATTDYLNPSSAEQGVLDVTKTVTLFITVDLT